MQQKIKDIKTRDSQRIISWEAPEEINYQRSSSWYTIIIAIALALIGIFIWMKQYTAVAVMVAIVLVLFSQAKTKSKIVRYTLTPEGINFKEKTFSFENLKSFWISQGLTYPKLIVEKTGRFATPITIYLTKININELRDFLLQYLPEVQTQTTDYQESVSHFMKF